jgi:opacity protein-like surface antigen
MIRRIAWLLGLSLLLAPLAAHAQKRVDSAAGFGVKLGLTVTNFGGEDADDLGFLDFENKLGFAAGALMNIPLSPMVSLQPELMFVTKGAEVEIFGRNEGYLSLNYLEIPVLVRVDVPVAANVAPFVVAGPALGFLLSAKAVDRNGNTDNIKDDFENVDLGFIVGGGLGIPLSSGGVIDIEVRYEVGLADINDDRNFNVELENRAFFILGGYRF